jgi:hypothetical protein
MNFISAGPSPAWLGAFAAISFGGLVAAAFASGYHLASDAPVPAASASASASRTSSVLVASLVGPARIAEPLVDRERAVLRAEPEGEIVDELPAGRTVTITRQSGEFVMLRYEHDGQLRVGWTHRVNIVPAER